MTDIHIQEISERITAPGELRRLGVKLGLPHYTIDMIFENYRDQTQKAYQILRTARNKMANAEEAFTELWKALCESGHVDIAHNVLNSGVSWIETAAEVSRHYR